MASRPVDRGFGRRGETKVPFHPVKGGFDRMGTLWSGAQERSKNKNCRKPGGFLQFGAQSRARTGTFLRNTGF